MKSFVIFLIFSFFPCDYSWKIFYRGRGRYGNLGDPIDVPGNYSHFALEKYFEQKLDHFNSTNNETWKQRYFVNERYYEPDGPVFLMIGGESKVSPAWLIWGTWLRYAEKYNALCIIIEHRFYGESHPKGDMSSKNLAYLSSEQALADVAWFISSYNDKLNKFPPPKWIVFGGSYSGSLASWMRLKYPHLVYGAVSSSGPLLALANFKDYFRIVRESLATYDPVCVTAIEKGTKLLSAMMTTTGGRYKIYKAFKLCDELDPNKEDDVANLYASLADNFAGVVQYNKDNRAKYSPQKLFLTIDIVCNAMLNESLGNEFYRLAKVNSLVLKSGNESCLNYTYEKMINELRSTSWENTEVPGGRQWTYQTCTEFGFFQTSDVESTQKMFGDKFPVEFFIKQCADIFGPDLNKTILTEGIRKTNMNYGGMDNRADNVVYVQGSTDPWHALGITHPLTKGAKAIYIEGTAHCANMYPSSPDDPQELVSARNEIESLIGEWLQQ